MTTEWVDCSHDDTPSLTNARSLMFKVSKKSEMDKKMDHAKVSVVMPVRDAESHISEAVESLVAQTFSEWELLVIDDGCEDRTIEVVKAFADDRIRVLELGGHYGIAVALNLGLRESNGRYIARLDADDVAHPSRLQIQVEHMDANPQIGLLGSWFETIESPPQISRHAPFSAEIYFTMLSGNPICHSSVMLRKSVLRDNKLQYRQEFVPSEDYDLWQRIAVLTEVEIFPEVLVGYRVHEAQSSHLLRPQRAIHDQVVKTNHRVALGFLLPRPKSDFGMFMWLVLNYFFWRPRNRESHQALRKVVGNKLVAAAVESAKRFGPLLYLARLGRKFR